jgi:hypothetical protein
VSANVRLNSLEDVTANRGNLRVTCGCGHVGVVDADRCCRWYRLHRWGTELEWQLSQHLRCSRCGGSPIELRMTFEPPSAPDRFPRNEDGWRQLWRRLRD